MPVPSYSPNQYQSRGNPASRQASARGRNTAVSISTGSGKSPDGERGIQGEDLLGFGPRLNISSKQNEDRRQKRARHTEARIELH